MQLNPSEEKWCAPTHSSSSYMAKAPESPSAHVRRDARTHSQGEETVLLGPMLWRGKSGEKENLSCLCLRYKKVRTLVTQPAALNHCGGAGALSGMEKTCEEGGTVWRRGWSDGRNVGS